MRSVSPDLLVAQAALQSKAIAKRFDAIPQGPVGRHAHKRSRRNHMRRRQLFRLLMWTLRGV